MGLAVLAMLLVSSSFLAFGVERMGPLAITDA
jgi:hypothetical protein